MTKYLTPDTYVSEYDVGFLTPDGDKLVREFSNPYQARKFYNKISHMRGYIVLFYPIFD